MRGLTQISCPKVCLGNEKPCFAEVGVPCILVNEHPFCKLSRGHLLDFRDNPLFNSSKDMLFV